jgi:glycosyltransferase involved in cell wall biosynthesis
VKRDPNPSPEGATAATSNWLVMRAGRDRGWGGDVRRRRIFERLAERTGAAVVTDWPDAQRSILGPRWLRWARRNPGRPRLAASEGPGPSWARRMAEIADPVAVAIYDAPVEQARTLGMNLTPEREAQLAERRRLNESVFRWHVVPTRAFAEEFGFDMDRVIVGRQGTVASHVRPAPWPDRPSAGMVSGAAPGRGIEDLVAAMRIVRERVPDALLYLWLVATSAEDRYLPNLRAELAADPWITIEPAPYATLGETLGKAVALVVPTPPVRYWDVTLPIKIFDSMAAGRPLVVTPRQETVAIVEPNKVGLVTAGDSPEAMADAIARLLEDDALARRMGAAGRDLAEREYDWPVLGDRIADEILRREG